MQTLILSAVLFASAMFAQESAPEKGAKALFLDPTSGVALAPSKPRTASQTASVAGKKPVADTSLPLNAGLMYYIERQRSDGQMERVNPTVTFRSGDRIRIQLKTNVEGRLTIAQRNAESGSSVLFPDIKVNEGDNRIHAGQVTALPSATSWFKFDENPGEEHLLVMLTPQGAQASPEVLPPGSPKQWDSRKTQELTQLAQTQKGSKSLVIEVDEAKETPATYIVQPAGKVVAGGVITTEVILQHR